MWDVLFLGMGWGDVAYTLVRALTGVFFAISGFNKLFNAGRHATLAQTLRSDGIPFTPFNVWFVPSVELLGGLGLVVGLLTPLAALGLAAICTVACVVDGIKRIKNWQPINAADYVDDVLYLPELIYVMILLILITHGGGTFSLDRVIYTWLFN